MKLYSVVNIFAAGSVWKASWFCCVALRSERRATPQPPTPHWVWMHDVGWFIHGSYWGLYYSTVAPACKVSVLSNENWTYKRADLTSGSVIEIGNVGEVLLQANEGRLGAEKAFWGASKAISGLGKAYLNIVLKNSPHFRESYAQIWPYKRALKGFSDLEGGLITI